MIFILCFVFIYPQLLCSQDLWEDSGEIFTDDKVRKLGSIVYIRFEEPVISSFNSSYQKLKTKNIEGVNWPDAASFLPQLPSELSKQENVQSGSEINYFFSGVLASSIVGIDSEASTYTVNASYAWNLDGNPVSISLIGIVNHRDVDGEGFINSSKIADVRISLFNQSFPSGTTVGEKDFTNLVFPSQMTNSITNTNNTVPNTIELNDEQKKNLYLKVFNLILNELF